MGFVWQKRVRTCVTWLLAFLSRQAGSITRTFVLNTYFGRGTKIRMTFDASPWGLGAILHNPTTILAWFAAPLGPAASEIFGVPLGSSEGQQVFESASDSWKLVKEALSTVEDVSLNEVTVHLKSILCSCYDKPYNKLR